MDGSKDRGDTVGSGAGVGDERQNAETRSLAAVVVEHFAGFGLIEKLPIQTNNKDLVFGEIDGSHSVVVSAYNVLLGALKDRYGGNWVRKDSRVGQGFAWYVIFYNGEEYARQADALTYVRDRGDELNWVN